MQFRFSRKYFKFKKNEIIALENNYESKINFYFNSQYSLHDPIIEQENIIENLDNTKIKIKKKQAKKEVIKKKKTTMKTKVKKRVKLEDEKNNQIDIQSNDATNDLEEEKTGWWS